MANNYRSIADEIIKAVGGKDNIISAAHCATRLRIIVKDREIINDEEVESIELVKGVFFNSGQYQIILGTGIVNRVYEEVGNAGISSKDLSQQKDTIKKQGNPFKRLVRTLGDVFVPIIPAIVATGLALGLKGALLNSQFLALLGLSPDTIPQYITTFIDVLSVTAFAFLPALVCWSAFKVFGGSPILGILLGLMLVSPSLPNAWAIADPSSGVHPIMAFGFIPIVGYQGSIIPALVAGFLGAKLERSIRKRVPASIDLLATPFLTIFIMLIVSLLVVGPVFHTLEQGLLNVTTHILNLPFGMGGLIIGFFWMLIVVTGVHHVFNILEISLISSIGFNPFNAIISMSVVAQGAVALAIALKSRKAKVKSIGIPSTLSAWLGITEPAIFGLNLRYNIKPFMIGCVVSGIGGMMASILKLQGTANGVTGIPGILLYIYNPHQLLMYILLSIAVIVVTFILVWLYGVPKEVMNDEK